jgi:hypothetical protein
VNLGLPVSYPHHLSSTPSGRRYRLLVDI